MFKNSALAALLLFSLSANAEDYVVHVNGLVCSFCAQGLSKKVSKLAFVDKGEYTKGVKVEIERQKVTVAVKRDATLDAAQLFKAIRSGGYEPVDIWTVNDAGELKDKLEVQP